MKRFSVLLLLSAAAFALAGAPANRTKNAVKLAPPPIVTSFQDERPKVLPTGEFSVMAMPAGARKKKAPTGSTAALLSEEGKDFSWKPSKLTSSTIGSADLTGATLSADGTLAVISERVGGEGKPNSTRLLFFNIPEQRLAGGFVIPERLLSSIRFVRGSQVELLALRHGFEPYNVKNGLVRINLKSRRIMDQTNAPDEAGAFTSFAQCGEKLVCSAENAGHLYLYDRHNLSAPPKKIATGLASPRVCPCGDRIAAFDDTGIQLFAFSGRRFYAPGDPVKAPAGFRPKEGIAVDPAVPAICFAGEIGSDLWYFRGNTFRKLKERCSGVTAFDENSKNLCVGLAANARLVLFQMPEGRENGKPFSPNNLRPINRNGIFTLLSVPALKNQLVHIDDRGNVFVLESAKARWKKFVIYTADRAGFR